ncbi:MAG: glycoside hydrolase family 5 protein [Gammaproteobacteria bacterium]
MITKHFSTLGRLAASGSVIFASALFATACMASTLGMAAHSQSRNAHTDQTVAGTKGATPDPSSSTELPPNWPWRGVTMNNDAQGRAAQPSDIDAFVNAFGINSVHLYMNLKQVAKRAGLTDSQAWVQSLQWLDAMVAECKKDHVIAIVHLRYFPAPGGGYYDQHSPAFWNNPAAVNEIYTWTAALVKHLQSYSNEEVAFDILSEPTTLTSFGPEQPPEWVNIQRRIVETIRANDPGRWVVVKPGPWGEPPGYADFSPLAFSRLVYSVHIYLPVQYTLQGVNGRPVGLRYPGMIGRKYWDKQALEKLVSPVVSFQNRYHVPIWVGEFSAVRWAPGSDQYLGDLVSIFDSQGWGWSYFSVGAWNGWDPRYDASYRNAKEVWYKSPRWHTLQALFGENGN